jgi:hypothetical protein
VSVIGGVVVVGLVLLALARLYLPESRNLVFGGPVEPNDGPSAAKQAQAISECLRDRERRRSQFVKQHGEVEIPVGSVWSFVGDEEARFELWKHKQNLIGFERLRAARVDTERLSRAISESGNAFGVEVFPDRRYLFTVNGTTRSTINDATLVSAHGFLAGSHGATGDWNITVNETSGEVIGAVDGSDSWTSIRVGIEDSSLTVFAEIDQCRRQQRLREYSF